MGRQSARVIRKYPNRRLYDTAEGRYVNLEDVAALVRKGEDISVLDAKTGEDVTRVVLTQIIAEDAKQRSLPLELLRQFIMASDRAGQDFLMWYFQSAFDAYRKVQDSVHARLSDVGSAALAPLGMMRDLLARPPAPASGEVEKLRRRVEELEAKLAKPAPRRGGRRK